MKKINQKPSIDFSKFWFFDEKWRLVLSNRKKYWSIPDLLELQKKWFNEFVQYYLPKLFKDINPIADMTWEQLQVMIEDVKVWEALNSIDICKKKELTYWWIISWKIKLLDIEKNKDSNFKSYMLCDENQILFI